MALSTGYCSFDVFGHTSSSTTNIEFVIMSRKVFFPVAAYRAGIRSITGELETSTQPAFKVHQDEFPMDHEHITVEIRRMLQFIGGEDPIQKLMFVDTVQRLGVTHHFEEEVEEILHKSHLEREFHTLHDVSLLFRLLRQHGQYYISADVFNNFKGENGRFKGELVGDIMGLTQLYEATHLNFEGEYSLDEAEAFSHSTLNSGLADMDDNLRRIVTHKIRHPSHKTIPRLTGRNFHYDLGATFEWEPKLRKLAAMDLQMWKSVCQEELFQVSKWWNELGICHTLTSARSRPLEWYIGAMVMLIDNINLSNQRMELIKPIAFVYLLDDIFDVYGTIEELTIFGEAIKKWDYAAIDTLPDYMKLCYKLLLDTTNDMGQRLGDKYGFNPIHFLKTAWEDLCNAYLLEAKWFDSQKLPNADRYLENGKVSSGTYVVLVHLFFLLGLGGTNGCAVHLKDISEVVSSVAKIIRLWNDLGCAKDEHQGGKAGSYIECYKNDCKYLSVEHAQQHALDVVAIEWKRLNKECINLNHVSLSSFKKAALNLARMAPLMYSYDDDVQQSPVLEGYVKFMFI